MKFLSGVFAGIATVGVLGITYAFGQGTADQWMPGGLFTCLFFSGTLFSIWSWLGEDFF